MLITTQNYLKVTSIKSLVDIYYEIVDKMRLIIDKSQMRELIPVSAKVINK